MIFALAFANNRWFISKVSQTLILFNTASSYDETRAFEVQTRINSKCDTRAQIYYTRVRII